MFHLRDEHMQGVSTASWETFEDRMVEHIRKYFPEHAAALEEEGMRLVIAHGIVEAPKYGFVSQRTICKFIDVSLALGLDFHEDERYAGVQIHLDPESDIDASTRADQLVDAAIDHVMKQESL